jgi:hypothetical protein
LKNKINFPETINIKESLFFILFFYCSIFILIPSSLFLFNIVQWEYDYWLLIYNLQFGLAVTSILIVIQFSLNLISKKISSLLIHSIILLTLIILLNDIIFPPQVGLIGLKQLNTETSFFFNIGEIFVILFLLIYYFSSYRKIYLKKISIFIIFLSVALFSMCILLSLSNNDNYKFEKTKIIKNKIKIEDLPNIYLFHLDGLQSDFAEKILDDNKNISENLTGFTFFKKNIANYAYTQFSVLSLLTSSTYKGQTKKKWEDKIKNGLLNELKETGYSVQLYGKNIFNKLYSEKIYFDKVYSNKEILKKNNINHPLIIKFTQILIIKYFPNLFSKKAIKLGEDVGIKFFTILNKSIPLKKINIQDGFGKYNSILATRSLINDLETSDKKNIFTYVVLDIPHYPYSFDKNCNWYESRTSNLVHDYYNQSVCAMNLVNNFIKKLKDINRYNDSIIIIYSDHGSHAVTQLVKKKSLKVVKDSNVPFDNTMSPWSIERLEAHARSVLMIKPKDSYNKIKYSTKKTQLLDVYPTLLDFLNIRISNTIEGKAIFSKEKQIYNQRLFSLLEPLKHLSSTAKYQNFKVSYDDNGVLQLEPQKKLRGGEFDIDLFFSKKFDQINKGKIKLFSKTVDKKIISYVDDIFIDGMDIINHWGSWTQSDKVTFALKLPQDKKFNFLTFDIVDAYVNEENKKISAKFFLNKKQIGKVFYNYKNKNFPDRIKFKINSNNIYKNKYNLIEISIEGATSPKILKKGFDKRNLGLAIKEIYFE